MLLDCCLKHHAQGLSVCPVCMGQLDAEREELERARSFIPKDLSCQNYELLERKAIRQEDAGRTIVGLRHTASRNPARREVFRLLGVYFPEQEARGILKQIHDYKWLEAERAGFDVWKAAGTECPFRTAAFQWALRHLRAFIQGCRNLNLTEAAKLA